jgi:dTDP-glucose 4,6-dehydratase
MLARGEAGAAYNLGSDEAITIAELAERVARLGGVDVHREKHPAPSPRSHYVPNVARARTELGLQVTVGLDEAIARSFAWAQGAGAST